MANNERRILESDRNALLDKLPALVSQVDRHGRYVFVNEQFASACRLSKQEIIGRGAKEILGDEEFALFSEQLAAATRGGQTCIETETRVDDTRHYYQSTYIPHIMTDGELADMLIMSVDITEIKKRELRLADSEKLLHEIADNLPVLISYIDRHQKYRFCNATFEEWLGLKLADIIGRPVEQALGHAIFEERRGFIERALAGERVEFELESHALGITRHQRTVYTPHKSADGSVLGIYTISADITALKAVEKQLTMLARFDSLTGLPNRQQLNDKLAEAVGRSRRSGKPIAAMFLDIDHFKSINDSLGHAMGDEVLKTFARRLAACVRGTDTVARLAGDEFVIILENLNAIEDAARVAEKIISSVAEEIPLESKPIRISTSIGIAFSKCAGLDARQLLVHADRALYKAKNNGRNTYCCEAC